MAGDYTTAGDKAAAAGIPLVEPELDKVRFGGDEINITRDWIAQLNPRLRVIHAAFGPPSNDLGKEEDIYFGVI